MNKKTYLSLSLIFLIFLYGCAGYEPIFNPASINFEIKNYTIEGEKSVGKNIYSKLNILSKTNQSDKNKKNINLLIDASKNKSTFSKNSAGKILSYKITINIKINITDSLTNKNLLNKTFVNSLSYKIQEQFSDTVELENKTIDTLTEQTYENLLISLSEAIL